MHGFLLNAVIFLAAAVVAVPLSKRLGFGSVLGYLAAGLVIGPAGLGLVSNVEDIMHFSEFGVVLLLFLIGLELEPRKLWQLRLPIFGMGGAQVALTTAAGAVAAWACGASWPLAWVVGMGFALSSTALALQILAERKMLGTVVGRSAFSVLLFQDLAVIPMIAILPLLATGGHGGGGIMPFLQVVGILVGVMVAGRLLLNRVFRWIASVKLREVFTALTLLLVVGMAALMQHYELSMGLGAFIAGLLLADSEYKRALEADIEPFKGLLLGLFFIAVGMSVDVSQVMARPGLVFGAVAALFAGKALLLAGLGVAFRLPRNQIPFFALVLAQVGEFAFVLFDGAQRLGVISAPARGLLVAITAVSILVTPLLMKAYDFFLARRLECAPAPEADVAESSGDPVIIAGFGRVGQIVGRFLFANGVRATVLDFEPGQVESLRRFGFKVFYGDATRLDFLEAAGIREAKVLVVAIDDVEGSLSLVDLARQNFPHLKIVSRARNVAHLIELEARGVTIWERETFDGALRLGRHVLEEFGIAPHDAHQRAQKFRILDEKLVREIGRERRDEKARVSMAKQAREDIERLFADEDQRRRSGPLGWGPLERQPEEPRET